MFDSREQNWADLKIYFNGNFLIGARAVMDETTSEDEHLYAAGNLPHAIQSGNKSYKGSVTLLKSEIDQLNDAAVAAGYDDLTDIRGIDIVCTYNPAGINTLRTRKYKFIKFQSEGTNMRQGDKFMEKELPFLCLAIERT